MYMYMFCSMPTTVSGRNVWHISQNYWLVYLEYEPSQSTKIVVFMYMYMHVHSPVAT